MADISIYGRLWNQTTDGEIASAEQVKDSSFSKASEVDTSGSNPSQHDINEYLLDAIGTGGTASADALAQKVDKTTTINGHALDGDVTLSASDLGIDTTLFKVVSTLPTSDIDTTKIYIVASETTGTNNAYTEYVYVNSAWEKVGEYQASVDLSGYVKENEEISISDNENGKFASLTSQKLSISDSDTNESTTIEPNSITLSDGSTTKTLTTEGITKLEGIEEGAQKNQNAFSYIDIIDGDVCLTATKEKTYLNLHAGDNIKFTASGGAGETDQDLTISCTATADEALTEEEINAACS